MFREMRRAKQKMTNEECIKILENASSGTLALSGDEGYPYAVPISFVYSNGKIYFHSAKSGHKTDAIKNCPLVSFCVIAQDEVQPSEFTTHYKSVIVFGKAKIIEDENEIINPIKILSDKYCFDFKDMTDAKINQYKGKFCIIELNIEHMSGKKSKYLMSTE